MIKKGESDVITMVLTILLVLAAIVIIWQDIRENLQPQFTITQETCWNDTQTVEIMFKELPFVADVSNPNFFKLSSCISGDGYDEMWACVFKKTEQKCNQTEVDDLRYGRDYDIRYFPYFENDNCNMMPEPQRTNCYDSLCIGVGGALIKSLLMACIIPIQKTISKSELTESWLNDNCECIEKVCPKYLLRDVKDWGNNCGVNGIIYSRNVWNAVDKLCSKWKCYDYEVTRK